MRVWGVFKEDLPEGVRGDREGCKLISSLSFYYPYDLLLISLYLVLSLILTLWNIFQMFINPKLPPCMRMLLLLV